MKRAQSISINTIIVAAIALLVLVIISVIFMQRMGWFGRKSNDCKNFEPKGCDYGPNCPSGYIKSPDKYCYSGDEVDPNTACCIPLTR